MQGKSAVMLKIAEKRSLWSVQQEPIKLWYPEGIDYLTQFFDSPSAASCLALQKVIMESYVQIMQVETECPIQIFERSAYSAANIMGPPGGYFTENETNILQDFYCEHKHIFEPVHGVVYLRSPPELCFERQQAREADRKFLDPNRKFLCLDHAKRIHDYHERFFGYGKKPGGMQIIDEHKGTITVEEKADVVIRFIESGRFLNGTTSVKEAPRKNH